MSGGGAGNAAANGVVKGTQSNNGQQLVAAASNGMGNGSATTLSSNDGGNSTMAASLAATSQLDISGGTQQQPNSVLRVIIDNMIYPVTLDVLYAVGIFGMFKGKFALRKGLEKRLEISQHFIMFININMIFFKFLYFFFLDI